MTDSKIIIWQDKTITYKKGLSTYTEKIVEENADYYTVVSKGSGLELWKAGYAVGNRVYKKEQLIIGA
tara:strand:- start:241 stop:444 length:204 start_codon:yes stop_codon:yes gene_type:complete